MVRKERRTLGAAWARWTTRYPRWILVIVLLCTLVFTFGLTRIEFGSQPRDYGRPESKALLKTIETDFQEGNSHTLIFVSKNERTSLLEPDMLHQQFRVLQALKQRFPVDTFSLVDAIRACAGQKRCACLTCPTTRPLPRAVWPCPGDVPCGI